MSNLRNIQYIVFLTIKFSDQKMSMEIHSFDAMLNKKTRDRYALVKRKRV